MKNSLQPNPYKILLQLFIIILCFFISCCSPKKTLNNTLFVALDSKPSSLDPRRVTDANGMRLVSLIFNGLVKKGDQGELLSDLALKWELEGLTYTFYLKPNLSFSNGRAVTKEDILFSFEEFQKKSSPFYSAFKNINSVKVFFKDLDEVSWGDAVNSLIRNSKKNLKKEKTDELAFNKTNKIFVVQISMKNFQAPFLYTDLQVIKILPKREILEFPEAFQKKPIGTGLFLVEKNSFREILLKRREATHGFQPEFISFQIIRDSFTRTQKMLSREMDIAPSVIPLEQISRFVRQKEHFHILSRPGLSTTYLLLNFKNKFLQKQELRKALSLSINRKEIIKYKLHSYAVPARSFINPENYFFNQNIKKPLFDIEAAKNIIRKLGLEEGLRFQLSSSNNQDTINKARVLASQMSQTGIKVSLKSNEWGAFYKDVGQGAYEIALMKWVGVTDPDIYRVAFHSENIAPKGRNRSFYKNKALDQLLEKGFQTRDKDKRKQIYDQIQRLIAQDFIVIPLWHDMEFSVLRANIKNYHLRQNGDFLSLPLVEKSD